MKKSKFTSEPIIFALRQAEAGLGVDERCRKLGISQATFFRWKEKDLAWNIIPILLRL